MTAQEKIIEDLMKERDMFKEALLRHVVSGPVAEKKPKRKHSMAEAARQMQEKFFKNKYPHS